MTDLARELAHEIVGICSWQDHGKDSAQIEREVTGIIQAALRTARREARKEALEAAAKVAVGFRVSDSRAPHKNIRDGIAAAIRKLIGESNDDLIERLNAAANPNAATDVNCVYCGHRYGPGETTPVSMADEKAKT